MIARVARDNSRRGNDRSGGLFLAAVCQRCHCGNLLPEDYNAGINAQRPAWTGVDSTDPWQTLRLQREVVLAKRKCGRRATAVAKRLDSS
jgi:hypothetical protein